MIHLATRKVFKSGRSRVLGLPDYVVRALGIVPGDVFVITFDDERKTITAQPFTLGGRGPGVNLEGQRVDTMLMP